MKLFIKAGNPPDQDWLNLETWLMKAVERCQRVGNLKTRLEKEKLQVMEKMRRMEKTVPEGWKAEEAETTGCPSHQQIHTRAREESREYSRRMESGQ